MYVGRIMHTSLVTVLPETLLTKAKDIIAEKRINHLLVVDKNGELIGLLSDVHELNYLLSQMTVEMIMVKKIISISPGTTIERAARIMQENRISALPVMEGEKLVGIITTNDVMGVLLRAIGFGEGSTRFIVLVEDRIGVLSEVAQLLKEHQVNIRSLVTWPERKHPGIYQLVMRVAAEDGEKAISVLGDGGFKVLTAPYLPNP